MARKAVFSAYGLLGVQEFQRAARSGGRGDVRVMSWFSQEKVRAEA
jgi:hypothetical protein